MTHPVAAALPFAPTTPGAAPSKPEGSTKSEDQDFSSVFHTPSKKPAESDPFGAAPKADAEDGETDEDIDLEGVESDIDINLLEGSNPDAIAIDELPVEAEVQRADIQIRIPATSDPKTMPTPVQRPGGTPQIAPPDARMATSPDGAKTVDNTVVPIRAEAPESAVFNRTATVTSQIAEKPGPQLAQQALTTDLAKTAVPIPAKDAIPVPLTPEVAAPPGASTASAAILASQHQIPTVGVKPGAGRVADVGLGEMAKEIEAGDRQAARSELPTRLSARTLPVEGATANIQAQAHKSTAALAPVAPITDPTMATGDQIATDTLAIGRVETVTTQVTQLSTAHAVAGPATARHAASQMAIAVTRQGGTTEMALNPPELGKVRLTLKAQDTTIVLMVQAERPETSDMMRRHIDILSQEFRALGYGNIRFEFGDGTSPQAGRDQNSDASGSSGPQDADLMTDDATPMPQQIAPEGGLDLRL